MAIALFDCRVSPAARDALDPVWQTGALAAGPAVSELERRLAQLLDGRSVAAMSDMTQALAMALRLAGVKQGDEVATLALNCMSSNSAIAMLGATPVWVDVDPVTVTVDLNDLKAVIGPRTRAVAIYHVAGRVANLDALRRLCDEAGLPLIEDANNALGATWHGRPAGTFGTSAVFSFYANRQLNGIEGAALACDPDAAARVRTLRRFGIDVARFRTPDGEIDPALDVPEIGVPASLPNVNATLALCAMDDLSERLACNRDNAARLRDALHDVPDLRFVEELDGASGAHWVALVRSPRRDDWMPALKAKGIPCSRLHQRNDRYTGFGATARHLPGTDVLEREMFALPVGWWLSESDLTQIVQVVQTVAKER